MTPAHLELGEELFLPCGYCGCQELGVWVLVSGGTEQLKCCAEHGQIGIAADAAAPGVGWRRDQEQEKKEVANG